MASPLRTSDAICVDEKISPYGATRSTVKGTPLSPEELRKIDAYWRASLYLCLGMLYLKENPLLHEPLNVRQIKPRLLGHWGSDAGQSFSYIHFNRLINKYDLNAIYISGPGHGAPAVLSNAYLEGTYSEVYPDKAKMSPGCNVFSNNLVSLAGSAATQPHKHPVVSTKVVSSATASRTLTGRSTTIRI
jgi:xylulose-5-phosphate/fructose-6-phosphate phosphoketolase